jgi:hypothetical protein
MAKSLPRGRGVACSAFAVAVVFERDLAPGSIQMRSYR